MKNKNAYFMEVLKDYFDVYLPYSRGASPNTIKSYKYAFKIFFDFLYSEKNIPVDKVSFEILEYDLFKDFFLWLEKNRKCGASTQNQRISAMTSFANYAQNRDFDTASIIKNSINKIPVKRNIHAKRSVFTLEEVSVLLNLPSSNTKTGIRDKTLLSVMYASGSRAQEICDITVGNILFYNDKATLTIKGKGNKVRRVSISKACSILLRQYIRHRNIENCHEKHVFSSHTHEKMTISCVEGIFKKYLKLAKKENPSLFLEISYSPHSMRRSTATHMLEAGVPLVVIKNFLGHSSLQSTQIYYDKENIMQSTAGNAV